MQKVIDGTLINYELIGKRTRGSPPLVILHGWGRNLTEWQTVAKRLSEERQVILVDIPGFGGSSLGESAETMDSYKLAKTISAFLQKIDINKFMLMGHSFGGKIGIVIAAKSNKVEKLILVSPSGIENKSNLVRLRIFVFKAAKLFFTSLPASLKRSALSRFESRDYRSAGKMRVVFRNIINQKVLKEAKEISCPTLIIWGERDPEVALKFSKRLKDTITGSVLRIVWESGHFPHITHEKEFMEILSENL